MNYAGSQLAADVEALFRSSPLSNRNSVWFICSNINTKGFSFHRQMPAELFSALLGCCCLSLGFPPRGKFSEGWLDWQLKNATVEWGASQVSLMQMDFSCFVKKVESWNSKAWKQNGISGVVRASGTVYIPLSQRKTFWIVRFIPCNFRHINQKHLHDTETSEVTYAGVCGWDELSCI